MKSRNSKIKKVMSWLLSASLLVGSAMPAVQVQAAEPETDKTIVYNVNCGDTVLPEGENFGIYNGGAADQAYVENSAEYSWGYDSSYEYDPNITPGQYGGNMVRMVQGNDAAPLSYYFELPAGKYNIEVGIPYCGHWGNRVLNVDYQVGDNEKTNLVENLNTTNDIPEGEVRVLTSEFEVTGEKEKLTVSAVRSNDGAWAPFMGSIKISVPQDTPDPTPTDTPDPTPGEDENVDDSIAYNVNCGDTVLSEGENFGIYNGGAADQVYAENSAEYSWGYDGSYEYDPNINRDQYAGNVVRMVQGNDAAPLSYYFELPAGKYNIEVGIPHCGHWGNRVLNVDYQVGDNEKTNLVENLNTTDDIPEGEVRVLTSEFEVTGEKEKITVSAVRSNDGAWAPFIGSIKISIPTETPDPTPTETPDPTPTETPDPTPTETPDPTPTPGEDENVDSTIAYNVNCYDTSLPEGEKFGIYNGGAVDQVYAENSAEYSWGYDGSYEYDPYINRDQYAGNVVRMVQGDDAAPITYYFELPAGKYSLEVGIPHCSHWGNRVMNVDYQVENGEKINLVENLNTTNDIPDGTVKTLTADFVVTGEKQKLTVSAVRSNSNAWAPFIGSIKISKSDALLKALREMRDLYERGNDRGIYTQDSWEVFAKAYEAAKNLQNSTDESAKAAAIQALTSARDNLVRSGQSELQCWTYDFEEGISDASLVINKNGISNYDKSPVYGEGRNGGQALKTGIYGLCLNKKNIGDAYTVNVWAKADVEVSNNTSVVFLGYHNPEKWLSLAGNGSGQCKIWTKANNSYNTLNQTLNAPRGEWVMYTVTSDGAQTTVYENGEKVVSSSAIANVLSGSKQDIYLGVNAWDGHFRGMVDDVSVYDGYMTQEEIYKLYEPRDAETILKEEGFSVPQKKTIVAGASKKLEVRLPKGAETAEISFVSAQPSVAAVDDEGVVTGKTAGTAKITTTVQLGAVTKSQTTMVTVRSADKITDETVAYFVDCGNEDSSLAGEDLFGRYNRVPDQKLGKDAVTGKTWGWEKIGSNAPNTDTKNGRADEDSREYTTRSAGSGSDFYYEFELPANVYQVEITVPYFLDGSNTRTFEVVAGSKAEDYETIANNINTKYISGASETYVGTCSTDGTAPLRLSFLSDSDAWGPIVSAIKITEVSAETCVASLKETLALAGTCQVENYRDESYQVLEDRIQEAQEKLPSITSALEAKELEDALKAAIKGLKKELNTQKMALADLIAGAETTYQEADYTESSYAALQNAIKEAKEQMDSAADIAQVMKLRNGIQKAVSALEKKAAVSYTVTFQSAGGTKVASQSVKKGAKASAPKVTRRKYLFAGWYLSGAKYDFSKPVTSDLTLTAKWTKVTTGKAKIKTLRSKKAKQCVVKAKKVKAAAGYQYVYSTNKKFKKAVKKSSVKNTITLKKLKKGKRYYVKVRAYRLDSQGKKVYGKYSAKKSVVIKK